MNKKVEKPVKQDSKPGEPKGGLLDLLFSLFSRDADPDKEKKRALKELAKTLNKSRFNFYLPKTEQVQPKLARFFHSIYKLTSPASVLLENMENSPVLKNTLIESILEESQAALRSELEEENIRKVLAQGGGGKAAQENIRSRLEKFTALYNPDAIQRLESLYEAFHTFYAFISMDYYFFLRKFDSRFPEGNLAYNPNFEAINGEYILDDLKDYLEVIPAVILPVNWDALFDFLLKLKGSEMVARPAWKKMLQALKDVHSSQILQQIVCHLDKNPFYKPELMTMPGKIVEDYLSKLKTQVEMTIQMVLKEEQAGKMGKLVVEIFGTESVVRLSNYTEKANMAFNKKNIAGFLYPAPLNYLKAFILDFVKKDVREAINLLIVKGDWSARVASQQLSEAFAALLQVGEDLVQFDDRLSNEGDLGAALWAVVKRAERDANAASILKQKLKDINEKALDFIRRSGAAFVTIAKNLKLCMDDREKAKPELITNWKTLDSLSSGEIKTQMNDCYRKIYYFVQLLQYYIPKKGD
ncbi:MAG: DUF5312 domain-containing protein [Spirochaetales bacterium]|jgi:hypothetical protein|nr:DUF5312 domain-containing protein [Spirochaetales bacterium]